LDLLNKLSPTTNQTIRGVKYVVLVYNELNLKINFKFEENLHFYFKEIFINLGQIIDFIVLKPYHNLNLLIKLLHIHQINNIIMFKNKYGYDQLNNLLITKTTNLDIMIKNSFLFYGFLSPKTLQILNHFCDIHGTHKHFSSFVNDIKPNINKMTIHNMTKLFEMYVRCCAKKFTGFLQWGPGNHSNSNLNVEKHYHKHITTSSEPWDLYFHKPKSQINLQMYRDFPIKNSHKLKHKMIHTNGTKVYLSGVFDKILVIGRLDKNNVLGVSSCYVMTNDSYDYKMKVFQNNKCFDL
jgi:hypothetical protein